MRNRQEDSSQLVERHDSGDEEPPQLEGGENEKKLEENDEGEPEEETEQSGQEEEEAEERSESPLQNPLQESELAQILANMGEYGQPSSPSDLHEKL